MKLWAAMALIIVLGGGLKLWGDQTNEYFAVFTPNAEKGNPIAQDGLGICYSHGYGVKKDEAEAVNWFRKAAQQGNADAEFHLAFAYETGAGVPKDITEGEKWD